MAGIYLHIPYCKTKCPYCDFYSITDTRSKTQLIQALLKELELRKDYLTGKSVQTIYFGGGTPSLMKLEELEKILDYIQTHFNVLDNPEITIECNPDDLSLDYLKVLKKIGNFRLNLGVQSFHDDELQLLERRHDAAKSQNVLKDVFHLGFKNVGIDLIYGLPGSRSNDLLSNLKTAFQYPIQHLSAYHLTIEPGTPFYQRLLSNDIHEISDEESRNQFFLLLEQARIHGFEQYEISNFARNQHYSKHNTSYWQGVPYLGIGPSAHSFNGTDRHKNVSGIIPYLEQINSGEKACTVDKISYTDRFNEYLLVSLRTKWGLSKQVLQEQFPDFINAHFYKQIDSYFERGWMTGDDEGYYLTDEGQFISDTILSDLFVVD